MNENQAAHAMIMDGWLALDKEAQRAALLGLAADHFTPAERQEMGNEIGRGGHYAERE